MRCFYHEDYYLPLPEGHPFPMEKFPEARTLLGDGFRVEAPARLSREDLERVHCPSYLDAVSSDSGDGGGVGLARYDRNRLGLPANPRLLERSALEAAGTVAAAFAALDDGIAANLAGGTHHAFPDRGLGYCVLNDVAVAVAVLRARGRRPRTLIVDTDAHQGNGTHAIFRGDAEATTYSIHVGRNYPSAKEPGDRDAPLERYVRDADYLEALRASLPPAFEAVEPDLVFWVSGADPHRDDRFGQMALSAEGMARRDRAVLGLCRDYAAPTVVLYGGGYNRGAGMTARLHAQSVRLAAASSGARTRALA